MARRGRESGRDIFWRYGGAFAVFVCAVALRWLLDPWLGSAGFTVLLIGTLIVAWIGGLGPSLLSQTVLLFISATYFSGPANDPPQPREKAVAGIVAYYFVGSLVALLSERVHAARRRMAARNAEADTQRERLRATVSCMGDGVLVVDHGGRVTMVNAAAERTLGWTERESIGHPLGELFPVSPEGPEALWEDVASRVLREGVQHRADNLTLMTRGGGVIPVAYSAAPISDAQGDLSGAVVVFRDETERKRAEQSLRDADRRKDEFLATLAHELRNPLVPIRTGLELLKNGSLDVVATQKVRAMMERQTDQMVRLIDDLLDVSRITRGKMQLRKAQVQLSDVVGNAVEAIKPFVDRSRHTLNVVLPSEPVLLDADGNRLTQVLTNLLHNATKYTPPDGRIEIRAAVQNAMLELDITDNGQGIQPAMAQRIFEMFAQSAEHQNGQTGLGIGLTLAKSLVELHGGTIEVHSEGANCGSTFRVRMPVLARSQAPTKPAESKSTADQRLPGKRVLVVDDNEDARDSLGMMARLIGNEVRVASDGLEAVEAVRVFRPHIVLMDIGMPRLDGCGAARRIRSEPWGQDVLLIATTGWGQDDDRRRTLEAGFDHHLVKPIDPAIVQNLLRTLNARPTSQTTDESGGARRTCRNEHASSSNGQATQ